MTNSSRPCPCCGQVDKTYKVSLLYLESTARLNQQSVYEPELDCLLVDLGAENYEQDIQKKLLSQLARSLTPPSGGKKVARRIHPDSMVIFFSLLALLIVFQIVVTQAEQIPIIIILVAGSILAYLLARKTIIRRYEEQSRREMEENTRLEAAVARWMRLYFCSRDKGVFDPERNRFAPLEQMSDLLNTQ